MTKEIIKVFKFLKKNHKFLLYKTILVSFLSSIFQSISIFLIYPIIYLSLNSNVQISEIKKNNQFIDILNNFLNKFDLRIISIFLVTFLIFSLLSKLYFYILNIKISGNANLDLKMKNYKNYFGMDYLDEIKITKSNLITHLNVRADKLKEFVQSTFNLLNNFFNFLFLALLVLIVETNIIFVILTLITIFIFFYNLLKKFNKSFYLKEYKIYKIFNEINISFLFSKYEILMNQLKNNMLIYFKANKEKEIKLEILKNSINFSPRLIIEFFLYILIAYYIYLNSNIIEQNIAQIGVIALAGLRIMPTCYSMYKEYINLRILKNYFKDNLEIKKTAIKKNSNIKFKNLNTIKVNAKFSYDQKKYFRFNFLANKGDKILFFGPSGSGKSTLIKIIAGIIKIEIPNIILVNNKNIHQNISQYWKNISYLAQDGLMMPGTLKENITLKKKLNNDEEKRYKEIFYLVQLFKIIKDLKKFNNTFIDFDSKIISGGQKQRILIARALFKKADILLFDESFNQLDRKSEIKIIENIKKKFKDKIIIISSHRPVKNFYTKKYKL